MKLNASTRPLGDLVRPAVAQASEIVSLATLLRDLLHHFPPFRILIHPIRKAMRTQLCLTGFLAAAMCCAAADANQLYRDALTAYDQGRYADAERLHLEALPLYRAILPPDHELIVTTLHNLGLLARTRGDYTTATRWLNEGLAVAPARSVLRADMLNASASVLQGRKRPLEAEPLVREAISILEALPQPDNLKLADALNTLGTLHLSLQDPEGATRQFTKARDRLAFVAAVPPEFRCTLAVNLAASLFAQGKTSEALSLYSQALRQAESSFGPNHPRTGEVRQFYAEALSKTGNRKQARALIRAYSGQ